MTLRSIIPALFIALSSPALSQEFWSPSTGPWFAYVTSLGVGPNDVVYAGGRTGLIRSTNRGLNWSPLESTVGTDATHFAISPRGTLFIIGRSLLRSSDDGATWAPTMTAVDTTDRAIAFARDSTIFYGARNLYRSTDDGVSWRLTAARLKSPVVSMVSLTPDSLLVATNDGVFLWRSAGDTVKKVNVTPLERPSTMALDARGDVLLMMQGEIYRSTNRGKDWTLSMDGATGRVYNFWSMDRNRLFIHRSGTANDSISQWDAMYRRWTHVGVGSGTGVEGLVGLYPRTLITTGYLGIVRTTDGRNWTESNTGILDYSARTIAVAPNGDIYTEVDRRPIRSRDLGLRWERFGSVNNVTELAVTAKGTLLCGDVGLIYRTQDRKFWFSRYTRPREAATRIVCAADGAAYARVGDTTVMRSLDDGESWRTISHGWPGAAGARIGALEVATDGSIVVGLSSRQILLSTDRGDSWREHPAGTADASPLHPLDGYGLVYLDQGRAMVYDDAMGASTRLGDDVFARATDIVVDGNRIVYISTAGGTVHRVALDGSIPMSSASSGLLPGGVHAMAIHPSGYLFASTRGIQRSGTAMTASVAPPASRLALSATASADGVAITFELDWPSNATIALVNSAGERVAEIGGGDYGAGRQRAWLATGDLASGVYLVELRTRGVVATVSVAVVR